jgi:hypothetical protein
MQSGTVHGGPETESKGVERFETARSRRWFVKSPLPPHPVSYRIAHHDVDAITHLSPLPLVHAPVLLRRRQISGERRLREVVPLLP